MTAPCPQCGFAGEYRGIAFVVDPSVEDWEMRPDNPLRRCARCRIRNAVQGVITVFVTELVAHPQRLRRDAAERLTDEVVERCLKAIPPGRGLLPIDEELAALRTFRQALRGQEDLQAASGDGA